MIMPLVGGLCHVQRTSTLWANAPHWRTLSRTTDFTLVNGSGRQQVQIHHEPRCSCGEYIIHVLPRLYIICMCLINLVLAQTTLQAILDCADASFMHLELNRDVWLTVRTACEDLLSTEDYWRYRELNNRDVFNNGDEIIWTSGKPSSRILTPTMKKSGQAITKAKSTIAMLSKTIRRS